MDQNSDEGNRSVLSIEGTGKPQYNDYTITNEYGTRFKPADGQPMLKRFRRNASLDNTKVAYGTTITEKG